METKAVTFILTNPKTWTRQVRIFVLGKNKKLEERSILFTTEHIVASKQRTERGHQVPAEFTTADPVIIEAMYRDTAYGKNFVEKGDPEGKKRTSAIVVTEEDKELAAIRGLFKQQNLTIDESLPLAVLKEQYAIHMAALSGISIKESAALQIPHVPVDVKATIADGVNAARAAYLEKYGEPVPAIVENDLGFLDALADPNFDAQKYIEEKVLASEKTEEMPPKADPADLKNDLTDDKEVLHTKYFEKFKTQVPNPKKNDIAWIKGKLEE